jgi:hypothetical protein
VAGLTIQRVAPDLLLLLSIIHVFISVSMDKYVKVEGKTLLTKSWKNVWRSESWGLVMN